MESWNEAKRPAESISYQIKAINVYDLDLPFIIRIFHIKHLLCRQDQFATSCFNKFLTSSFNFLAGAKCVEIAKIC